MFTAGAEKESPAGGDVLVTSRLVTTPRAYKVKVFIAAEEGFWARFVHRKPDGTERSHILLPVTGIFLGPLDLCEMYFADQEYAEIQVREGVAQVNGTVQASIELL